MPRGEPLYRRLLTLFLGRYSVRVLLGWVMSLGLILLLFRLPLSASQPRVGWTARQSGERISLTQISPEEQQTEQESEDAEAPPTTRHAPPEPASATGTSSEDGSGEDEETDSKPSSDTTSTTRSIADLSIQDRRPKIVGGRGALSLHINYPAEARREGIEGQLTLTFTVDTEGEVRNIVVSDSLHPACDSAAVEALRSVRFQPGTYDGEAVPVRMSLPIRFQLQPGRLSSNSTTKSTGE